MGLPHADPGLALTVVPNPSGTGEFSLSVAGGVAGPLRLTIVDALGRVVLRDEWLANSSTDRTLNLRDQQPGVYGLRLVLPDGRVATRRLLRL